VSSMARPIFGTVGHSVGHSTHMCANTTRVKARNHSQLREFANCCHIDTVISSESDSAALAPLQSREAYRRPSSVTICDPLVRTAQIVARSVEHAESHWRSNCPRCQLNRQQTPPLPLARHGKRSRGRGSRKTEAAAINLTFAATQLPLVNRIILVVIPVTWAGYWTYRAHRGYKKSNRIRYSKFGTGIMLALVFAIAFLVFIIR
jgi:hypothetical protein